jgi:hypothetical protein
MSEIDIFKFGSNNALDFLYDLFWGCFYFLNNNPFNLRFHGKLNFTSWY